MGFFSEDVCSKCQRNTQCSSPYLKFSGEGQGNVLVIKTQPAKEEDNAGKLGFGRQYRFLNTHIENFEKHFYVTNLVQCYGEEPTNEQIDFCSGRLQKLITKLNPTTLILVGELPFKTIVGPSLIGRIKGTPWTSFLYTNIPDQEHKRNIITIPDEAYFYNRKEYEDGNVGKPLFERDPSRISQLQEIFLSALLNKPVMKEVVSFQTCTTENEAYEQLKEIKESWKLFAMDYETTGIMPFKEGHKIISLSLSNHTISISFPLFSSERFRALLKSILCDSSIKKIIHNAQYEMLWTKHILGYWIEGVVADTMLSAHCLNNQTPNNLKFQTYINFGVIGYDEDADSYIKSNEDEGSHGFNTITSMPIADLLKYNAYDSWFTYKLYQKHTTVEHIQEGYNFLLQSALTLVKMTYDGLCIDEKKLQDAATPIKNMMDASESLILSSDEVKQWPSKLPFNFNSSVQLGELLFNILKVKPLFFTPTKRPAVNEEALQKYASTVPFISHVLRYRKLAKIHGTYLRQYTRECVDSKIHPNFFLDRVQTFRSSAGNPNIQQSPKRDVETKYILRSFIVPRKGHRFIEYDYKSLEVIINCCHSNDPTLKNYILDPSTDMHRDGAMDVFMLTKKEVTKEIRSYVKGDYIFAEFYGSYYPQVASALWDDAEVLGLRAHLKSKGIKNYADFEEHIKECENKLWTKRFPTHNEWRQRQWEFYKTHGYIDSLTGFRCLGPMTRNNSFNCAVQGDAYHVLQWTLNKVYKHIEDWNTKAVAEIHDSQMYDVDPTEEEELDRLVYTYGTQKVKKYWNWITCPLTIEKERSEIDGTWAEMKDCGILSNPLDAVD